MKFYCRIPITDKYSITHSPDPNGTALENKMQSLKKKIGCLFKMYSFIEFVSHSDVFYQNEVCILFIS